MDLKILMENPDLAAKMRFEILGSDIIEVVQYFSDIALKEAKPAEIKLVPETEACKRYSLTRQTFYALRKAGKITFRILGSRIYYIESELIAEMDLVKKRGAA